MKTEFSAADKHLIRDDFEKKIAETLIPVNNQSGLLQSFSHAVSPLQVLNWLRLQENPAKLYWSSRDGSVETAGIGLIDVMDCSGTSGLDQALKRIEEQLLRSSSDIRYYGGMCFDADNPLESWESFGDYRFCVPEFELRRIGEQYRFIFNIRVTPQDTVRSIKDRFLDSFNRLNVEESQSPEESIQFPAVIKRTDIPDSACWRQKTNDLIDCIRTNDVQKVVHTRITSLELQRTPDPLDLLFAAGKRGANLYEFCFQFDPEHAFIGCSPECLYRREKDHIYSEAVAGTNAGTSDQKKNFRYQEELLGSQKEAQEHEFVFENIKSELENICRELTVVEKRKVLSLDYIQHLRSCFEGVLKSNTGEGDILRSLHPTAAVNGSPKEAAQKIIRQNEPFSRGWYAGPVGWIGRDSSEFAVAIRSAYINRRQIKLFAGAGIVAASDPDREWAETEIKMAPFLDLFEPSSRSKSKE